MCWSFVGVYGLQELEFSVFFFQAEDGIRDIGVTGVQTCALPILRRNHTHRRRPWVRIGLARVRAIITVPMVAGRGAGAGGRSSTGSIRRARRHPQERDRKSVV